MTNANNEIVFLTVVSLKLFMVAHQCNYHLSTHYKGFVCFNYTYRLLCSHKNCI
jgi:hypothetical protein